MNSLSRFAENISESTLNALRGYFDHTESMISFEEGLFLYSLAREVRSGCIVEIGSYRGGSAVFLGRGSLDGARVPVYAVDPHKDFTGVLGGVFGPQDRTAFYRAMLEHGCSEIVSLINLSSEGFAPHWKEPVSLLWIDGDHSYPGVKRDFELWMPHLTAEAIVVFDDAMDPNLGPRTLIDELTASGKFEEMMVVGKVAAIRATHIHQAAGRMTKADLPRKDPLNWDFLRWNSFLSDRHKLLYIATPKVACTLLKWWFADLEGYSEVLAQRTDSSESDPDLIIHDSFHKVAPSVTGLPPEALAGPLTSEAYFRFAVVRNPYERIFSAWQSKLLLREAIQAEPYRNFDFFWMPVQDQDDLARAFESFLLHLAAHEAPDFRDFHWTPQADLLQPDLIHYTSLSRIEEPKDLKLELARHLGPDIPDPFAGQRKNQSLIPYSPEFITARAGELIQELYASDFQTFGYERQPPRAKASFSSSELGVALRSIAQIRGRNRRISEMQGSLSNVNRQLTAQRQTVLEGERQVQQLNRAVVEHEKRIIQLDLAMQSLSSRVAKKEQVIQSLSSQVTETERELIEIRGSRAWKFALLLRRIRLRLAPPDSPLTRLLRFLVLPLIKLRATRRLEQDQALIVSSGLFDADWYLAKNPDVALRKVDPLFHYLFFGGFEGRDPGPGFSSAWYLNTYPDVNKSGINPLVHYLRSGKTEGRAAQPVQGRKTTEV